MINEAWAAFPDGLLMVCRRMRITNILKPSDYCCTMCCSISPTQCVSAAYDSRNKQHLFPEQH
jgi:hypothetical protein